MNISGGKYNRIFLKWNEEHQIVQIMVNILKSYACKEKEIN